METNDSPQNTILRKTRNLSCGDELMETVSFNP